MPESPKLSDILEDTVFSNPPYEEKYKSNKPVLYTSDKFPTLRANAGSKTGGIAVRNSQGFWRKLHRVELERLQTVPEGFTKAASFSEAKRMLGNGWTVDVISKFFFLKNTKTRYAKNKSTQPF